jgi:hypothetical protein
VNDEWKKSGKSSGITNANYGWAQYQVETPPASADAYSVQFVCYLEKPKVTNQSVANFDDCSLLAIDPPIIITLADRSGSMKISGLNLPSLSSGNLSRHVPWQPSPAGRN